MTPPILTQLLLFSVVAHASQSQEIATFSIVARDPATGELGVAVQSKFLAVGAVVPYARAKVGAIASQSLANPKYGPIGLDLLASGANSRMTLRTLINADPMRNHRQLAIIGKEGNASVYTGAKCLEWSGSKTGRDWVVAGNLLAGPGVIDAMARTFDDTNGTLAERMIASLKAGQKAGGDKRGRQSAALLVVRQGWGYAGLTDRFRDLRVDDHPQPIDELERIYRLHRKLFPRADDLGRQ